MLRIDLRSPVYPVDPGISIGEFERLIMGESYEVVGVFDEAGLLVLAPKSGGADTVGFVDAEAPYLRNATVTHNHPEGGAWPGSDLMQAVVESSLRAWLADSERRRILGASILKGRERDALLFDAQRRGFGEIGVQMERSDVWRR